MARNFCGRCGARVTPDQAFCEQCGHRIAGGAPPAPAIPKTRHDEKRPELPKRPAVHPTMPMDPTPWPPGSAPGIGAGPGASQPGVPHAGASHPGAVFEPPRRRRRWPWFVLLCLVAFMGSAAGGWFGAPLVTRGLAARYGLPTFVGEAEVLGGPDAEGDAPRFDVRLASLPSRPRGATLATPVYEITPRGEAAGPFEVALPLLDPSDERPVVVGHLHDGRWRPLATEIVDGRAIAVTDSFSKFAGFYPEDGGPPSPAEVANLRCVSTPRLVYGEATPEPAMVFDLRGCTWANRRQWGRLERQVVELRVEVSVPEGDRPGPSPQAFATYAPAGEPLRLVPSQGPGRLPVALEPLSRTYDQWAAVTYRSWLVRFVPVFDGGGVGQPTEATRIYPDVLRAMVHLSREVPFDPATRATFDARVAAQPVRVVFGGYTLLRDAYNGSLAWSRRRGWGRLFGGVAGPHVGLTETATYGDVVTHEWGHYAAHMALGDEYEQTSPGGAHNGWVESTRALAFTEDLATLLGQWGTGTGVPAGAGAMLGHPFDMSRHPAGEGPRWPTTRTMDAVAVETVPATVMSRLAQQIGFAQVFSTIASARPRDLVEMTTAFGPAQAETLQPILIDEGVSWLVRGRVVRIPEEGGPPEPLGGARVRVRTLGGVELAAPAADASLVRSTSAADGTFVVRAPQGEVLLVAEHAGYVQRNRVTFTVETSGGTNVTEPQAVAADLELERGLEVVIESPAEAATVTERIQLVRGRVEARPGTVIDRMVLRTANGEVQVPLTGDRFEGRVTLRPGDNVITATAHTADGAEASATVTVRAEIQATVVMCELTWARDRTDVDLWVTDPEGVSTGFRNRRPREGRQLDVDNTRGFGPETYTMTADLPGPYEVRVNYYSGQGPVGFTVRWCLREGTPEERCGTETGSLAAADHNGSTPAGNHRFTIQLPPAAR